jgi:hypothetical protein
VKFNFNGSSRSAGVACFSLVTHAADNTQRFTLWSPTGAMSPLSINSSVFESPGEENKSGYLSMTSKEGIFSPGHVEENPFKYSPHMQQQGTTEMELPHQMNLSSDNNSNMGQHCST